MTRIVVTGGSGKAGRAVVHDLVEHGHQVVNVDVVPSSIPEAPFLRAELTDLGETIEALRGADVVVHLAAIPAPRIRTVERTFEINILSTYNVFSAAALLGLERVVWASSETVLGLPFGRREARNLLDPAAEPGHHPEPDYAPIDEEHPLRPHSSYSLTKVMGEEMARQFARWTHIPFIGLRFSAIREPAEYASFPDAWSDPLRSAWNMWAYVDARDVAQACRLSLTADLTGAEAFIIAAGDTVMDRPNRGAHGRGLPGGPAAARHRRLRHVAVDRQGPPSARLRPGPLLARQRRRTRRRRVGRGDRELGDGHRRGRIRPTCSSAPRRPRARSSASSCAAPRGRPASPPRCASRALTSEPRRRSVSGRSGDRDEARLEIGVAVDGTPAAGDLLDAEVVVEDGQETRRLPFQLTVEEPGWRMFMISHFHYDPVWWNTQAAYTETWGATIQYRAPFQEPGLALVKAHLEMARRDPDYKFVLAELDYLKPYWDAYPEDRAYVRQLLADGRLEFVGGTYNEPNTNLTSAESTIRNAIYGIGYQRDVLGGAPATAWQLDAFGHDPQFPGIMADAGVTSSSWARGPFHEWGPNWVRGPGRMPFAELAAGDRRRGCSSRWSSTGSRPAGAPC